MTEKKNIFIASSAEGITVAEAVNIKLSHEHRVKQWDNAFDLSSVTITSLIQRAKDTDFGVFVFHKDDETIIRGDKYSSVRDNVLFELGLFIGSLGLEKCFILVPSSKKGEFRLPTDLSGVTMTFYDDQRDDVLDAVTTCCAQVKNAIRKQASPPIPSTSEPAIITILENQLRNSETEVWTLNHEVERANADRDKLLNSIQNQFFSIAKPATPAEILAWESGAKGSYLTEVKISHSNVYYVDRDVVVPPLYGANAFSLIVADGVNIFGIDKWSHNSIYYMDGFRSEN